MKILHVWDQAGVACIIAKYQSKLFGHETKVIKRTGFDPYEIFSYYGGQEFKAIIGEFFLRRAAKIAADYDIIHVHDHAPLVSKIKNKYPNKKVFLHYHGTELRNTPQEKRIKHERNADGIFVAMPDLLKFIDAVYIPIPIDTELFSERPIKENGKALCIMTHAETPELIAKWMKGNKMTLDYETLDRSKAGVTYPEMPELLEKYEYYVDLKNTLGSVVPEINGTVIPGHSTTGLEALAMGLKVLNWEYKIVQGLPDMHRPENVARQLEEGYATR